jgi:YVTN family beta-propeller protein
MTEAGRVPLDKTPRALDLDPSGRRLYFTVAGQAAVLVLDTATGQVTAQIPVGASPHHAPLTRDGRWALVPSQGPSELAIVDTGAGSVAGVVGVGRTPHWVASSADATVAYVTNEASNDVSVVDLVSRRVLATVAVGNAPRKVAVQPGAIRRASGTSPSAAQAAPGALAFADRGTVDARASATVVIGADDYYFEPSVVRVRPGQQLHLAVVNRTGTLHNLSAPALGLDRDLPPRVRTDVAIAAPPQGAVDFFCKFHGPLGQGGRLLVADRD